MPARILVVTAVTAELDAALGALGGTGRAVTPPAPSARPAGIDVLASGVGPAAAAAGAAATLAMASAIGYPYTGVICLGIGGGFAGRGAIGDIIIGTRSIAADLGADSPDGFLPVESLGFGRGAYEADGALLARLREALPRARVAAVLTVSTVTGTAHRAADLATAHPDAAAEAMEGFGVAVAAAQASLPFVEMRAISNLVGPRDRDAWRIREALASLSDAAAGVGTLVA